MINQRCKEYVYDVLDIKYDQPALDEIKFILRAIKNEL